MSTACTTTKPKNTSVPSVPSELSSPSMTYLTQSLSTNKNAISEQQWLELAQANYKNKKYARALRAANEVLRLNENSIEAREIAMLSTVKVTESNISSYHDNALMNENDKSDFKSTLTELTTIINSPD